MTMIVHSGDRWGKVGIVDQLLTHRSYSKDFHTNSSIVVLLYEFRDDFEDRSLEIIHIGEAYSILYNTCRIAEFVTHSLNIIMTHL